MTPEETRARLLAQARARAAAREQAQDSPQDSPAGLDPRTRLWDTFHPNDETTPEDWQ